MQLSRYLLGFALLVLASCSPSKRIIRIAANHPGSLAGPCAQFYPVKVIDSTRIERIEGQTVYDTSYITVDCDSVVRESRQPGSTVRTSYVRVPCPPSSHRVDTITTERFRQVENTAKVEVLTKERDKALMSADRYKRKANFWMWLGLGLLAYFAVRIALRFYTRISLP